MCDEGYTAGIGYLCRKCTTESVALSALLVALAVTLSIAVFAFVAWDLHGDLISARSGPKTTRERIWAALCDMPFGKLRAPIVVLQVRSLGGRAGRCRLAYQLFYFRQYFLGLR